MQELSKRELMKYVAIVTTEKFVGVKHSAKLVLTATPSTGRIGGLGVGRRAILEFGAHVMIVTRF